MALFGKQYPGLDGQLTIGGGNFSAPTRAKPVVPPQPQGEDVTSPIGDTEYVAYKRTCETIGFEPVALIEAEILAFMAEKKMKRYDNAKVSAFLTAKATQLSEYHYWQWVPLREKDAPAPTTPRDQAINVNGIFFSSGSFGSSVGPTDTSYQKAIPLRVLARVEQFIQKFGDKVRFMVSDYAERRPDPFIAVMPKAGGTEAIIFDVWDEPDFR